MASTIPEIAFSVHVVTQFISEPRRPHLTTISRIIQSLRTWTVISKLIRKLLVEVWF